MIMTQNKYKRWLAALLTLFLSAAVLVLWRVGLLSKLRDVQALGDFLAAQAPWSHLVFFGLQLCSVIIAPIPSNLVAAAGGAVFGVWTGFLITMLSVTLGSCITFWLARTLCKDWADRLVRRKLPPRYQELIHEKRDLFLFLAFLFPFFPDDLLCIMAGLTDIPFPRFLRTVLLARPLGLLAASAFGGSLCSRFPFRIPMLLVCAGLFLLALIFGGRLKAALLHFLSKSS